MFLLLDNYDSFTWNLYQALAGSLAGANAQGNAKAIDNGSQNGATIDNQAQNTQAQNTVEVVRNDKISIEKALGLNPLGIVISPGPGRPEEAGISLGLIDALLQNKQTHASTKPPALLGVCLGMQCLAQSCGGKVVRAKKLMHGKTSQIKLLHKSKENGENENGNRQNGAKENGDRENGGRENGGRENGGRENGGRENGGRENGGRENPLFIGLPETLKATRYHSLVVEPESLPSVLNIDAYSESEETHDGRQNERQDGRQNERQDGRQGERVVMALSHKKLDLFGVQFHPESIACEHGTQLLDNFVTFCLNRH